MSANTVAITVAAVHLAGGTPSLSPEDVDVVRAWKDAEYRQSLTPEQLAQLPDNPAGSIDLVDAGFDAEHGTVGRRLFTTDCPHLFFTIFFCDQ